MSTIAKILSAPPANYSTTLSANITNSDLTIGVNSVTGLGTEGIGVLYAKDADGLPIASSIEFVHWTGVSGNNLTLTDTDDRGISGSASGAQSHNSGDTFEVWIHPEYYLRGFALVEHNSDGTHIDSLPLTTPKITTSINDANGNEVIKTPATASAVNEVTVTNAATGDAVEIAATGGDTNIDLKIGAKGTGEINQVSAVYQTPQTYTPTAAGTATLDLSLGNDHEITMPAGNITIALSNAKVGQKFIITILQDSTGSRTVTWFTTIKWAGGSAPTLTTTASKKDVFGFKVTGSGTYDGFIVGQNL